MGPLATSARPLVTPDKHVRPRSYRNTARRTAVSLPACLPTYSPTGDSYRGTVPQEGRDFGPQPQPLNTRTTSIENNGLLH